MLKVAMIAPPWLNMPPTGYGGIEYVVHYLTVELRKLGVHVEIFTVGDTTTPADKLHWYYEDGQYRHIHKPFYDSATLPITHILFALNKIREAGDFDIIHDHNGFIGPAVLAHLDDSFPPVLHTLHGAFSNDTMVKNGMPDNRPMYSQFTYNRRLHFNGISHAQLNDAPEEIARHLVNVVHNGIDLTDYPLTEKKSDYFITLARFNRDKGQATAARYCEELGLPLKMAGIVAGISTPKQLMMELADSNSSYRNFADFIYYRDKVLPYINPGQIDYVGSVNGESKTHFMSGAKALLWPIDWEEPFGMAPIEVMACGTPVVAFRRGAVPEMIVHGVNGFIADTEEEFKYYMTKVDEIKPEDCRRIVEERFSSQAMARKYLARYQEIVAQHNPVKIMANTTRELVFMERLPEQKKKD